MNVGTTGSEDDDANTTMWSWAAKWKLEVGIRTIYLRVLDMYKSLNKHANNIARSPEIGFWK